MPSNQHSAVGMEQQLQKLTQAILARGELLKQLEIQCEAIQASVGKMKPIRSEVQTETKPVAPVAADSTPMSTATGCTTTTLTRCLTPCPTHDADAPPPPSLPIGATSALLLLETTSMLVPTSVALPSASTPTSTCPQEVAPTPPTTTSMPDVTIISPEPTVTTIWVRDGTSGIAAYQQLEEMPLAPPVTVELDVDREGFCTPGMCMSIFSSLVNADKSKKLEPPNGFSKLTVSEAKRAFSGNLCRCTGYRPIVDVCKSFASDVDLEDLGLNIFWKKGGKQPDVSKLPSYTFGGELCTFPDFLKSEIKSSLDYLNGAKSQSVPWPMFKCYEGSVQLKQSWAHGRHLFLNVSSDV